MRILNAVVELRNVFFAVALVVFATNDLRADQYHYNNIIVGDRAMGLGGAYTAIADDASGVVYNPAGLGFALSNDISGSANAFYQKQVVYKNIIGSKSYTESSRGMFNPFFGGLQKLDNVMSGLVFAFGLYSSDAELKDQNDLIVAPDQNISRFHRSANIRAATNYFGVALGKRIGKGISLGVGVNALWVDELVQIYQDAQITQNINGTNYNNLTARADRNQLLVQGVEPVFGLQVALFDKLSLGLTYKQAFLVRDTMKISQESTQTLIPTTTKSTIGNVETFDSPSDISRTVIETEVDGAIGNWPHEIRFGAAYFATSRILLSLDVVNRGAAAGDYKLLERDAVTNYAFGSEIYLTGSFPLRLGFFTNYDARPAIDRTKANQDDHIDYYGGSIFFGWVQPNSQVALGTIVQAGQGESQKISGSNTVQDVVALSTTIGVSATHNF